MRLLVSIVNYRVGPLVVECLRSLEGEVRSLEGTRVVVVDNDSGDDSCALIQAAIESEGWQDWAELLPSARNGGFSYGNNLAIRPALEEDPPTDLFLLLNPDTRPQPGSLAALVAFAAAHPRAGIVGSQLLSEEGEVLNAAFRFPTLLSEAMAGLRMGFIARLFPEHVVAPAPQARAHRTDWVSGAALLMRRELLLDIGLLDEHFFLYYEELEFCLRAHRAGWECWHQPESRVVHLVGRSTGVGSTGHLERRRPRYWYESRQYFYTKSFGRITAAAANLIYAASLLVWKLRRVVEGKPRADPPGHLRDLIRYCILP